MLKRRHIGPNQRSRCTRRIEFPSYESSLLGGNPQTLRARFARVFVSIFFLGKPPDPPGSLRSVFVSIFFLGETPRPPGLASLGSSYLIFSWGKPSDPPGSLRSGLRSYLFFSWGKPPDPPGSLRSGLRTKASTTANGNNRTNLCTGKMISFEHC
jgi:hypothetical protein